MAEVFISNIERDGERRTFRDHGGARLGAAGGVSVLEATFEPGWRWSEDVAPIAGTDVVPGAAPRIRAERTHGHRDGRRGPARDRPRRPLRLSSGARRLDGRRRGLRGGRHLARGHPLRHQGGRGRARRRPSSSCDVATQRSTPGTWTRSWDCSHSTSCSTCPATDRSPGPTRDPRRCSATTASSPRSTGGTFRAHLVDVHGDAAGHVMAQHLISAERNGETRVSRGSILFTFIGEKATDLLELHGDLAGDDAFFSD